MMGSNWGNYTSVNDQSVYVSCSPDRHIVSYVTARHLELLANWVLHMHGIPNNYQQLQFEVTLLPTELQVDSH